MSAKFVDQSHHSYMFVNTHAHAHTHAPLNRHPRAIRDKRNPHPI